MIFRRIVFAGQPMCLYQGEASGDEALRFARIQTMQERFFEHGDASRFSQPHRAQTAGEEARQAHDHGKVVARQDAIGDPDGSTEFAFFNL